MRKTVVSLILIWTLYSVIILPFCSATSEPSVPEFTLRYVDNSFNVPPTTTYTTDPYTGKIITSTVPGYYVENKSVQVIITNPSFTSYKDENGSNIDLFYHVLFKGHFEDTWSGWVSSYPYGYNEYDRNSSVTVIPAPVYNISVGGQVDVQVRALIGKFVTVYDPPVPAFNVIPYHKVFVGEASPWSPIQTITISNNSFASTSPSSSQPPSAMPSQPVAGPSVFFDWILAEIAGVVRPVVVLLIVVVVFLRGRRVNSPVK